MSLHKFTMVGALALFVVSPLFAQPERPATAQPGGLPPLIKPRKPDELPPLPKPDDSKTPDTSKPRSTEAKKLSYLDNTTPFEFWQRYGYDWWHEYAKALYEYHASIRSGPWVWHGPAPEGSLHDEQLHAPLPVDTLLQVPATEGQPVPLATEPPRYRANASYPQMLPLRPAGIPSDVPVLDYIPRKRDVTLPHEVQHLLPPVLKVQATGVVPAVTNTGNARRAGIDLILPTEDAVVWVEGTKMTLTGKIRHFHTPPLDARRYRYDITARWQTAQGEQSQTRTVVVVAGEVYTVDFATAARN